MRAPSEEEAISRAIAAWTSSPDRPRPCRARCTALREGPASLDVELRNDALELLAIYRVGPRKATYLALETDATTGAEWTSLNRDRVDQAEGPVKAASNPISRHGHSISAQEAVHGAILAWTWDMNKPTPCCGLCTVKGGEPGRFLVYLWGKSQAVLAVYQVDAYSISLLEKETARARKLAWTLQREEEAS